MELYYHKTDGGAEYLTDKYIINPGGSKEGVFEGARYIVRIDRDVRNDAELLVKNDAAPDLLEALKHIDGAAHQGANGGLKMPGKTEKIKDAKALLREIRDCARAAIRKAEGRE